MSRSVSFLTSTKSTQVRYLPVMFFFGFGGLIYVSVLLLNAIAVLSEDRFLARIGFTTASDPGFGGVQDTTSVKAKIINLIRSVRTVARIPLIAVNTLIITYELILG